MLNKTAIAALAIACIAHVAFIIYLLWILDPAETCQRLATEMKTINCSVFESNIRPNSTMGAIIIWIVAAIVALAARFLPWYASLALPLLLGVGTGWILAEIWKEDKLGSLPPERVHYFAMSAAGVLAYIITPVIAAWMLGFYRRARLTQS